MSDPPSWPNQKSATLTGRSVLAVMESVKELTETYEFEELKYQTPVPPITPLNLTAGNPVVPVATILGTIASNAANYPQFQNQNIIDFTDVYDFWMWFAGGVNQAGRTLKYRRVPTIDTYSYGITNNNQNQLGVAPPVYHTRFGNNLQVGPVPDNNYQYFVRVKLRHPFPISGAMPLNQATFTSTITGGVVNSPTIVNSGTGYLPNSTVLLFIPAPPSGTGATGSVAINSGGGVASVNFFSGGSGYVQAPPVTTAAVSQQQIFLPDSWQEIVELCACQRLALWEGASQYIEYFEGLLRTKGIDIADARARKAQMVRDEKHNERSMSLMVSTYTWA